MESFLSLFIIHDSYVVSSLVLGITIVVVMLLLFNNKSPENVVKTEMGNPEAVEGALRRVLGEKAWNHASESSGDLGKLADLEKEVLTKDRTIAELNKQLTQSSSNNSGGGADTIENKGDNSELLKKISDLESRLQEYEIIEDDIADLSLYRSENEKLKDELKRLKGQLGTNTQAEEASTEKVQEIDDSTEDEIKAVQEAPKVREKKPVDGTDLVAEFEKVVNNQDQISEKQDRIVLEDKTDGKILVTSQKTSERGEVQMDTHPKLKNVNPDSKEEAEIFIADLKALKKEK
jgi:hypothetical protein